MVGLLLWYMKGLTNNSVVEVKNKILTEFGITRKVAYECYERLEADGLIKISRRAGKRPKIEILPVHLQDSG